MLHTFEILSSKDVKVIDIGLKGIKDAPNRPPVAMATVTPDSGIAGRTVFTFDATGSSDPDGDPVRFEWPIDAFTVKEGKVITTRLDYPGDNTVRVYRVNVIDPLGATGFRRISPTVTAPTRVITDDIGDQYTPPTRTSNP